MADLIQVISDELVEHWVKIVTAALFMLAGWFWGRRKERKQWERREFLDRLNISLNMIDENKLKIRTLLEKKSLEIFLNTEAVSRIQELASKTVPGKPIIPIPAKDCWYYLNAVLNELSETFSQGQLAKDLGIPTACGQYLVCLTNEADGAVRTRKLRAMVIQKNLLINLPKQMPTLESSHHQTRWETLKELSRSYKKTPYYFLDVELVIPGISSMVKKNDQTKLDTSEFKPDNKNSKKASP